ncbi:MAG: hypothetical protein H0V34_04790 [Gammaproteobacteria bacterium]|nr:hypothetical protein [Gammaproteobacteria bacterium]
MLSNIFKLFVKVTGMTFDSPSGCPWFAVFLTDLLRQAMWNGYCCQQSYKLNQDFCPATEAMYMRNMILPAALAMLITLVIAGCAQDMEDAGEEIDEAAEEAGDRAEDATD